MVKQGGIFASHAYNAINTESKFENCNKNIP